MKYFFATLNLSGFSSPDQCPHLQYCQTVSCSLNGAVIKITQTAEKLIRDSFSSPSLTPRAAALHVAHAFSSALSQYSSPTTHMMSGRFSVSACTALNQDFANRESLVRWSPSCSRGLIVLLFLSTSFFSLSFSAHHSHYVNFVLLCQLSPTWYRTA